MPITLEDEFHYAMIDLCERTKKEAQYDPKVFHKMLLKDCGVKTAKALLHTTKLSSGYTALWILRRLDLTVEAYIWDNPKFHELYSEDDLKAAQKRLTDYGYLK